MTIVFTKDNLKVLFLISLSVIFYTDILFADDSDTHKELRNPAKCIDCHIEKPEVEPGEVCTGKINAPIKNNVTEVCSKCHEYGERSHPTDIVVDFAVPADLPLIENKITCVTCHYPHSACLSDQKYISSSLFGGFFSRNKKHKTYYLRRTNTNGELCLACHK